jgi:hypothetical protein
LLLLCNCSMGLYGSKPIVSPKEAQALLGGATWSKLELAYRRIADGNSLHPRAFQRHFLGAFPMMVRRQHVAYACVLKPRWAQAP